eukprot:scaffold492_cov341-Pavlova_lutheri.AAC.8
MPSPYENRGGSTDTCSGGWCGNLGRTNSSDLELSTRQKDHSHRKVFLDGEISPAEATRSWEGTCSIVCEVSITATTRKLILPPSIAKAMHPGGEDPQKATRTGSKTGL